jgi:hypothetical protein
VKRLKTSLLVILAIAAFTASASARPQRHLKYGSKCGLVDFSGDSAIVDIGLSKRLTKATQLNLLARQQVMAAARQSNSDAVKYGVDSVALLGAQAAIDFLNAGSEGEESYIQDFHIRGEVFTRVLSYPGGNPVGVIFEKGSSEILAQIEDSDIICK